MASGVINGTTSNDRIISKIEWESELVSDGVSYKPQSYVHASLWFKRTNTGYKTSGDGTFKITIGSQTFTESDYFEKINAKDKLTSIGGRACLVLGTTEAANDTESPTTKVHRLILLSFYDFYQDAASVKYEILQFFYYDSSTGRMFIDKKLNELNKLLWTETIEHNFAIVPQWNVAKICEIYLNRSV